MSKRRTIKDRTPCKRILTLLRFFVPCLVLLLSGISLYIPCLRFTTADTGTGGVISTAQLLGNAWGQVRQYLFGSAEVSAVNEIFSWVVFVLILVSALLFLLGAAATVLWTVGALSYVKKPREGGTARALFLTLFPNRIAVCLWQILILPLLAFPRLLTLCYDRVLYYPVILSVTFPEPILIGGILYLLSVTLCLLSRRWELALSMSPYRTKRAAAPETEEEKEERSFLSTRHAAEDEGYYEMERISRQEQAERIRRLLTKREDESEDKNNE